VRIQVVCKKTIVSVSVNGKLPVLAPSNEYSSLALTTAAALFRPSAAVPYLVH